MYKYTFLKNECIASYFKQCIWSGMIGLKAHRPLATLFFGSLIMLTALTWGNTAMAFPKHDPYFNTQTDTSIFIHVKGTVVNEKKQPIAGASVRIKGTSKAAITNAQGRFSFEKTSNKAILIISSIGMQTTEAKINGRSKLVIGMARNIHSLEGVNIVSTGYQSIPKERATGSFAHIDNKLFNQQVSIDILSRLPTVANGLTINHKINYGQIMIRGLSTINSPMDPLIIVDNFPYNGSLNNINPHDVESITLLKDAAASSIWGTKAGNGVIVITTKNGRLNHPLAVEVSSNVTIGEKPDLFYRKNIPTSDYIDVEKFLFDQQYHFRDTANALYPPFSKVYEILFRERNGQITKKEADDQINALRGIDIRNEFLKYMYQDAVNQQYNVNMHGGSHNATYYFSAGLDRDMNNLAAKYNRLTLRLRNTYNPFKNLKVTTGIYYTKSKNTSGRPGYGSLRVMGGQANRMPYVKFADKDGNPLPLALKYRQPYIDTLGGGKLLDWNYYPLEDYKHVPTTNQLQDITLDFGVNYKIDKMLNIDLKYQYLRQSTVDKTLYDRQSFHARDMINLYSEIDANTGRVTYNVPLGGILDLSNGQLNSQDVRGQVNFNKTWPDNNISAIAGAEAMQVVTKGSSGTTYGYDKDILTYHGTNSRTIYPTLIGFGGFIPDGKGFSGTLHRTISLYANAAYTYKDRYIISASARRDGSNLFGATTKNKWKPLWSSGLSWIISKEKFYHVTFIDRLKLRATYGYSGNVNPSVAGITTIYYSDSNPYTQTIRTAVENFYNPDLRWENVGQFDVGLDIRLLRNRLSGSLDYYVKRSTDLLGPSPVDYTTGLRVGGGFVTKNVATLRTKGCDVLIHSLNIDRKFKWKTTLNFSINKDRVIHYFTTNSTSFVVTSGLGGVIGRPVYGMYSYKWAGLDPATGDPRGYLDGKVSTDYRAITSSAYPINELVYNGPRFPTTFGSIGNTFSYKNISLSAWITYKFGYYFRRESVGYGSLFDGLSQGYYDYVNRWQKPGDENHTNVPSMVYPVPAGRDDLYLLSEALIDKGDNVRLQYINISYQFTKEKLRDLPFESLKIYAYLNNLGIIWKANKDDLDPDYLKGTIPPPKSMSIGLYLTF